MKNWKTTLFGIIASLSVLLPNLGIGLTGKAQTVVGLLSGIGGVLFAYFAKDHDVTGGKVIQ